MKLNLRYLQKLPIAGRYGLKPCKILNMPGTSREPDRNPPRRLFRVRRAQCKIILAAVEPA